MNGVFGRAGDVRQFGQVLFMHMVTMYSCLAFRFDSGAAPSKESQRVEMMGLQGVIYLLVALLKFLIVEVREGKMQETQKVKQFLILQLYSQFMEGTSPCFSGTE
jgi:hypothetical protein